MIKVKILRQKGRTAGFSVSGHAGYEDSGKDIVCAAVTSAVQLTANGITEILHFPADVAVLENAVTLQTKDPSEEAEHFLQAFQLQLEVLEEQYPSFIQIRYLEV